MGKSLSRTMKKSVLRRRILAKYDTLGDFAKEIGVTRATMATWLNGGTIPTSRIAQISELLGIQQEDIGEVFFPTIGTQEGNV